MADMFNISTFQIQGVATVIIYVFLGMLIGLAALYILWQLYKLMTYNIQVTLLDKVGSNEIVLTDTVKKVDIEGTKLYHYRKINKYSPVFDPKFLKIFKTTMLGMPSTRLGFIAYKLDDKIVPVEVHDNPGIVPIDYDAWNYLVTRLRQNQEKYVKRNKLLEMLPYLGLFAVVIAFILGSVLWGRHVENVSMEILSRAGELGNAILEKSGGVQILN